MESVRDNEKLTKNERRVNGRDIEVRKLHRVHVPCQRAYIWCIGTQETTKTLMHVEECFIIDC